MQGKGLLIAAVILTLLTGAVYWAQRQEEAKKDQPDPDRPKLMSIAEADVQKLEIRKQDAPPVVIEKTADGQWRITAPQPLRADQDAVRDVVSTVASLTWDQLVEEKAEPAQFGLASPALQVQIAAKGGKTATVLVGDEAPTGGSFYAKLAGDARVFTVASGTKTSLDKSERDLRDRRMLAFNEDKLARIELAARGQSLELTKNAGGDWQITKPQPLRADGGAVDELIGRLREARMDLSEEEEKKSPQAFGYGSRVVTARVADASGVQELEVRKSGENYYARSSAVEGVHKISNEVAEGVNKTLADLRNKKVFDFGFSDPGRVEVKTPDKTYAFEKSGETWRAAGRQMDATAVQVLIDKLRELAATSFPSYGFGAPVIHIDVVSDGGKRTERVSLAKSANGYLAKRENEPALYAVQTAAVDEILKAAADVKEHQPPKAEQKK